MFYESAFILTLLLKKHSWTRPVGFGFYLKLKMVVILYVVICFKVCLVLDKKLIISILKTEN